MGYKYQFTQSGNGVVTGTRTGRKGETQTAKVYIGDAAQRRLNECGKQNINVFTFVMHYWLESKLTGQDVKLFLLSESQSALKQYLILYLQQEREEIENG